MLKYFTSVQFFKNHIISIILVCFFFSEALTKLLYRLNFEFYRFGVVVKVAFVVIYLIVHYKSILIRVLTLFFLIHFSGLFFLQNGLPLALNVEQNILYFSKYCFVFVVIDLFNNLCNTKEKTDKTIRLIFSFLRINFIFICLGLITGASVLRTYYASSRFGYDGLIQMNSHASYIYIFASVFVFYQAFQKKTFGVDLIIVVLSSLLVGTKSIYLFYSLTSIYLFFHFRLWKLFIVITTCCTLSIYLFKPFILKLLNEKALYLVQLYDEFGLFTALTSTRDILLKDTLKLAFSDGYWTWPNALLGGSFFAEIRTEFGFIDLFLFWGVIGGSFFLVYYYKKLFKFWSKHPFLKYSLLSICMVICLGGNFFTNAVISIYLVSISFYFKHEFS